MLEAKLETAENAKTFITAGHAIFSVLSQKSGKHFTYKVKQAENRETGEPEDKFFVFLLVGPENSSDYQYMGLLVPAGQGYKFIPTKASKVSPEAPSWKGFDYTLKSLQAGKYPAGAEIYHAGHCGRCGRLLTRPDSVASGLGPECAEKMGA